MIEREGLIQYAKDEDDYPVMIYLVKKGVVVDWRGNLPDEVLYIPEDLFESVGRMFIEKVGVDGYYGKTVLNNELIDALCHEREARNFSSRFENALMEIREFVKLGKQKENTHHLVFEGP